MKGLGGFGADAILERLFKELDLFLEKVLLFDIDPGHAGDQGDAHVFLENRWQVALSVTDTNNQIISHPSLEPLF